MMRHDGGWDVERLLIWTYRDQAAHAVTARVAGGPSGYGSVFQAMRWRAALGVSVDCSRVALRADSLPQEAESVHEQVRLLGLDQAGLVIMHARAASRPDWMPGARPRAMPVRRANGKLVIERDQRRQPSWCPIRWDPDPSQVAFARRLWTSWWDGLSSLCERLPPVLGASVRMPGIEREPWVSQIGVDCAKKVWSACGR